MINKPFKVTLLISLVLLASLLMLSLDTRKEEQTAPSDLHLGHWSENAQAAPLGENRSMTSSPFFCTLAITTMIDIIGENDFNYPAVLAPYPALTLAPGKKHQTVRAYDQYFRLDNAMPYATYLIKAIPKNTMNYNLGIIGYNSLRQPIISDTNAVDNCRATLKFVPDSSGPYFFKVSQISNWCTGGEYYLDTAYTPPSAGPYMLPLIFKSFPIHLAEAQ